MPIDYWERSRLPYGLTKRKGGRVVDGAGLENRNTRKGIGGSNPFPSAIFDIVFDGVVNGSFPLGGGR